MAPRPGDFIVFKTNGWAARLIQVGTRSRWNHAAIYIGYELGVQTIIEAQPKGVRRSRLSDYPVGTYVVSHGDTSPWQRAKVVKYARAQIGTGYGWLDIVALALVNLGIRPKWLDNYAANDDRLVCSQLVSQAYAYAGIPLTKDDPWTVSPGDLADVILEETP